MIKQLSPSEEFFLSVNRSFFFLLECGFSGHSFSLNGREHKEVSYYNYKTKKQVTILYYVDPNYPKGVHLFISDKSFFGFFKDINFSHQPKPKITGQNIEQLAKMAKSNKGLMANLCGHSIL